MERTSWYIIILLLSSFLLTLLAKWLLERGKVFDIPNERSSHDRPTPRGGGIAIVLLWYLVLIYLRISDQIEFILFNAFISGILIAVVSFIDDLIGIRPAYRVLAQLFSVLIALYFLNPILPVSFEIFTISSNLLLILIAVIGGVWFINLFNFLDGIDAYAAVEALLVSMGIYLFVGSELLLFLIAICLGFLIWNWPKAKVFMGDIGSTQLGFVLFIFGIYYHNQGEFNILFWLVITSLFWFDALLTLFRRIRNRENISKAHRKHAYQRIVQSGFSHQRTVLFAIAINIILIAIVIFSVRFSIKPVIGFLFIFFLNYGINKIVDIRKPFPGKR